ncbi:MAG: sterol desaturase family protein [Porticoccaceae bacterium]
MMIFEQFLTQYEQAIRLSFFFGMLAIMGVWELLSPKRVLSVSKPLRWGNNLAVVFLSGFLVRVMFPAAAVGMAVLANNQGWGLLNYYALPYWFVVLVSVVALDCIIYFQHVMFHAVPILWRLHRMHHADLDFDVTTGARFHPIEIILSLILKFAAVAVLGVPVIAVIIFEVLLNATAMFNHANVHINKTLDRYLRWILVTPDMHRVHHSIEDDETNSNFGFNLPWWDRLFGTYRAQPRAGHRDMVIGIHQFREVKQVSWLSGMLWLPFIGKVSDYAINRRSWKDSKD